MILGPVASGSKAAAVHATSQTPSGLGEAAETREGLVGLRSAEQVKCPWAGTGGRNWPQKGGFAGQMSFAIPSKGLGFRAVICG